MKTYWIDMRVDGTIHTNTWRGKNKAQAIVNATDYYKTKGDELELLQVTQ